jgi:tetratricopeptide (TPR) repeat protein
MNNIRTFLVLFWLCTGTILAAVDSASLEAAVQSANVAIDKGEYVKAESLIREIYVQVREIDNPEYALITDRLGVAVYKQGRYDEAIPLLKRAIALREKDIDPNPLELAKSKNNLANALAGQGRIPESTQIYEEVLRSLSSRQNDTDPNIATIINGMAQNLASSYCDLGLYWKSEQLQTFAFERIVNMLGRNSPQTAVSANELAAVYLATSRYEEALKYSRVSLDIYQKVYGEAGHPNMLAALSNIGRSYRRLSRFDEAEATYAQALALAQRLLPNNHPWIASLNGGLASVYLDTKKLEVAEPLLRDVLESFENKLGKDHRYVGVACSRLGDLFRSKEQYAESIAWYSRALLIQDKTQPDNSIELEELVVGYAISLRKVGRDTEAEKLEMSASKIRKNREEASFAPQKSTETVPP